MEQQTNSLQQEQNKKPKSDFWDIKLVAIMSIFLLLIIAVSFGVYYLQKQQKRSLEMKVSVLQNKIDFLENKIYDLQKFGEFTESPTKPPEEEKPIAENFLNIKWSPPTKISSLKIFEDGNIREKTAEYYKVGEFIDENRLEGDVVLVNSLPEGLSFSRAFYRVLKYEENGKIILFEKYSDGLYWDDGLDKAKISINKDYIIPSLEFPESFSGPGSRQNLVIDEGINIFFEPQNLKKAFQDSILGDVYTTIDNSSNSRDLFSRHGFYIKSPDGTTKVYYLKIDFVGEDKVPEITWSSGAKNEDRYEHRDTTGCGSSNYASVISRSFININNDLKPAGKNSKNDIIYELKDANHKLLKDFYENRYWVPENENKLSYDKFVEGRPIFFWIDPFGRLIKFENSTFVLPGECAKPVIYLYPEKTSDISVKIEPKGGITYSDPFYNNGWSVRADNKSNLTDLVSGKTYPYLFWEGMGGIYEQPQKGFLVERKNVHSFLKEKLEKLGLNEKETADFIDFWEPKMKEAPYYFVTFLGNREMEYIAPLEIDPKPDTLIRVLMDFSPLDRPAYFEEFNIKTPKRNGFTVVEWGGVTR